MLRRSGFARKTFERQPRMFGQITRPASTGPSAMREPVEKENALQHQGYMAAVRKLACARCQTTAIPRQFCHADMDKGQGIKTDCRRGWPGCDACHYFVGSTGKMGKEGRREFESYAGACTRAAIRAAGLWPKRLPEWTE